MIAKIAKNLTMHKADLAGVITSMLCLIHCLITVLSLLVFHYILGVEFDQHDSFHYIFLTPILIFGVFAFKAKQRRSTFPFMGFLLGFFLLALALYISEPFEEILTVLGSIIIIVSHIQNVSPSRGRSILK